MVTNKDKDYAAKPAVILFDLDGTITDMHPVLNWATPRLYKGMKTAVGALRSVFGAAAPAETDPAAARHRPAWHLPHLRRLVNPSMQDGLAAVLKYADENGIHTGIVSNGFATGWGWPLIQKYGISPHIDRYVFREQIQRDGGAIKPAPDAILLAMKKWPDIGPGKTVWFAGDMETDIIAAVAADERAPFAVVPVAIGVNSPAARHLRALQAEGKAAHGLIFPDYQRFAVHLSSCAGPRYGLGSAGPSL